MSKIPKIPNGSEDFIIQIQLIHKACTPMFLSILAKRTANSIAERKRIINLFFQKEFCRLSTIQINRIWRGGRGISTIRKKFIHFIQECTITQDRIIEGKSKIVMYISDSDTIIHTIKINPETEIRRYRNIVSNEFHSEHHGLIFELMCNGFNGEEISIKTGEPIFIIEEIKQKIISYLRGIS